MMVSVILVQLVEMEVKFSLEQENDDATGGANASSGYYKLFRL